MSGSDRSDSLVVRGGLVLDPVGGQPRAADVVIRDGRISAVRVSGQGSPGLGERDHPDLTVLDARGHLVVPGFVNAHYHSHDTLLKGRFETAPLEAWMLRALPLRYGPRSADEIYVRTLIGALECLRAGITTVQDMLSVNPMTAESLDAVLRAYRDAGLRVVLAPQLADVSMIDAVPRWSSVIPDDLRGLLEPVGAGANRGVIAPQEVPGYVVDRAADVAPDAMVTWGLAASGPERCSLPLLRLLTEAAERAQLPLFAHVAISRAEYVLARERLGGSAVRTLAEVGALGPGTTLAHCVWISDEDVHLLARTGTRVVANPLSNLKVKNGIAPLLAMYRDGVPVALGCDNSSCGDSQNMFAVMRAYALLAGLQSTTDATPTARDALSAATTAGAAAIGLADSVGALTPGARADLMLLDLSDPAYLPLNDLPRQLVFSESGRSVRTVLVGGRVVVRDGKSATVSGTEVRARLAEVLPQFVVDADRVMAEADQLQPYLMKAERQFWLEEVDPTLNGEVISPDEQKP